MTNTDTNSNSNSNSNWTPSKPSTSTTAVVLGKLEIMPVIALILIVSFIALIFILVFMGKSDSDTFKLLVGALIGSGFTAITQYYFGSSKGSATKDDTISNLSNSK